MRERELARRDFTVLHGSGVKVAELELTEE